MLYYGVGHLLSLRCVLNECLHVTAAMVKNRLQEISHNTQWKTFQMSSGSRIATFKCNEVDRNKACYILHEKQERLCCSWGCKKKEKVNFGRVIWSSAGRFIRFLGAGTVWPNLCFMSTEQMTWLFYIQHETLSLSVALNPMCWIHFVLSHQLDQLLIKTIHSTMHQWKCGCCNFPLRVFSCWPRPPQMSNLVSK